MKRRGKLPPITLSPFRIARLNLRPGDTVVLQTDMVLTGEQAEAIRDRTKAMFPQHEVVFLTAGVRIGVMRGAKP